MDNRILIDTNVLLDYLLKREPFYEEAKRIFISCVDGETKGCIEAHSVSNIFYILRKDYSIRERREALSELCAIFDVEGIDKAKLLVLHPSSNQTFSTAYFAICRVVVSQRCHRIVSFLRLAG